jgi:hypothetical protein
MDNIFFLIFSSFDSCLIFAPHLPLNALETVVRKPEALLLSMTSQYMQWVLETMESVGYEYISFLYLIIESSLGKH